MNKENTCQIAKDLLPGYHDDLLSPESKDFVEQHLHDCPDCQNYLTQMAQLSFLDEADDSADFVDYLSHIRKYQRKLLISNVIISFILGMALSFVIFPQIWLLNNIQDGKFSLSTLTNSGMSWSWLMFNAAQGYVAQLQASWWDIVLKMLTGGLTTSTLYLMIYQLFIRKHQNIGDSYSTHVLLGIIILLFSGIFTLILNIPYLLIIGLIFVILYRIVLRLRK